MPWFNFERIPVVLSDPYHYGELDASPVADLGEELVGVGAGVPGRIVGPGG